MLLGDAKLAACTFACLLASAALAAVSLQTAVALWFVAIVLLVCGTRERPGAQVIWGLLGFASSLLCVSVQAGVFLFCYSAISVGFGVCAIRWLLVLPKAELEHVRLLVSRLGLVVGVLLVMLAGLEAGLRLYGRFSSPPADASEASSVSPMPPEWRWRPTHIEGAELAFYWQGVLHCEDIMGFRRLAPLPAKKSGVFRIAFVGDSFTYGEGVDAERTYPTIVTEELRSNYRVDSVNMGIRGINIETIRKLSSHFLPVLQPDLVVYGVCLNDYGPEAGEQNEQPGILLWWQKFLTERTLSYPYLAGLVNGALIRIGVKEDFYGAALASSEQQQQRFLTEACLLSRTVMSLGLPPVIAMVLEQRPKAASPQAELAQRTEHLLTVAGMRVVPSASYFAEFDGKEMVVSPWEQHPSEEAHQVFAAQFLSAIRHLPELASFRRRPVLPAQRARPATAGRRIPSETDR